MSDDKKNIGSLDWDCINVNEDYELQYWIVMLGVFVVEFCVVVVVVGFIVVVVCKYLGKQCGVVYVFG